MNAHGTFIVFNSFWLQYFLLISVQKWKVTKAKSKIKKKKNFRKNLVNILHIELDTAIQLIKFSMYPYDKD